MVRDRSIVSSEVVCSLLSNEVFDDWLTLKTDFRYCEPLDSQYLSGLPCLWFTFATLFTKGQFSYVNLAVDNTIITLLAHASFVKLHYSYRNRGTFAEASRGLSAIAGLSCFPGAMQAKWTCWTSADRTRPLRCPGIRPVLVEKCEGQCEAVLPGCINE